MLGWPSDEKNGEWIAVLDNLDDSTMISRQTSLEVFFP